MKYLVLFIFVMIMLVVVGSLFYVFLIPAYVARKGRQVDVRVLSCEKKTDEGESYYNVTVDFYDLKGESIVKTVISEKRYEDGEVIRCRYLDKKGFLQLETGADLKREYFKFSIVFGFIIAVFLFMLLVMWWTWNEEELPGAFKAGFGYFIGIIFMLLGILGIRQKISLARDKRNMQIRQGVLVDFTVEHSSNEDGDDIEACYPIYEYEWAGDKRQLIGQMNSDSKKHRALGRKVHILVEPQTGRAVCEEDEKVAGNLLLAFGVIGVIVFAIMLAISFGILSGEDNALQKPESSGIVSAEKTVILDLFCDFEKVEIEKCSYWVDIYDDGSGRILLFPQKTVSDRVINQEITFTLSTEDMNKITQWVQHTDLSGLTQASRRGEPGDAYIALRLYDSESGEEYTGGGYQNDAFYAGIHDLLREVVPKEAWQEMEKRETEYYR